MPGPFTVVRRAAAVAERLVEGAGQRALEQERDEMTARVALERDDLVDRAGFGLHRHGRAELEPGDLGNPLRHPFLEPDDAPRNVPAEIQSVVPPGEQRLAAIVLD